MNSWSDYISNQSKKAAMEAFKRLQVDTSPFAIEILWTNGCWTFTQIARPLRRLLNFSSLKADRSVHPRSSRSLWETSMGTSLPSS